MQSYNKVNIGVIPQHYQVFKSRHISLRILCVTSLINAGSHEAALPLSFDVFNMVFNHNTSFRAGFSFCINSIILWGVEINFGFTYIEDRFVKNTKVVSRTVQCRRKLVVSLQCYGVGKCSSIVNIDTMVVLFRTATCKSVSVEDFEVFTDLKCSNDARSKKMFNQLQD